MITRVKTKSAIENKEKCMYSILGEWVNIRIWMKGKEYKFWRAAGKYFL